MIYNLGSINVDFFYSVPALPRPGETIAATNVARDLGGKGANMSIAAAQAGGRVCHIGAVGEDGVWAIEALRAADVETDIAILPNTATGQAIILRDKAGENAIVTLAGANGRLHEDQVRRSLASAAKGDIFLAQNETNAVLVAAEAASEAGAHVLYAAAPFEAKTVRDLLPMIDTLVLNAVEMQQLQSALAVAPEALGVERVVVTDGAAGAILYSPGEPARTFPAPQVDVIDTTGAGDTLTGYLAAGLEAGRSVEDALDNAIRAASVMTTRRGTASAIPSQNDVDRFEFRSR